MDNNINNQEQIENTDVNKKSIEVIIGRYVLPIAASILIFAGIAILIATLLKDVPKEIIFGMISGVCLIGYIVTQRVLWNKGLHIVNILLSIATANASIIFASLALEADWVQVWVTELMLVIPFVLYACMHQTFATRLTAYSTVGVASIMNIVHIIRASNYIDDIYYEIRRATNWDEYAELLNEPVRMQLWSWLSFCGTSIVVIMVLYFSMKDRLKGNSTKIIMYACAMLNVVIAVLNLPPSGMLYELTWGADIGDYITVFQLAMVIIVQLIFSIGGLYDKKQRLFIQPTYIMHFVVNAIVILCGFLVIGFMSVSEADFSKYWYASFILLTLTAVCLHLVEYFMEPNKYFAMLPYASIKMAVFILVATHIIETKSIVSGILMVWALMCVMAGFKVKHKPLRVTALVMVLVSIVKLVLFDTEYKSNMYRAVGYIVCGLLCLGISFVYMKAEKKYKEAYIQGEAANEQ